MSCVTSRVVTELENRSKGRWRPSGSRGDMRGLVAELVGQARQIGRFGSSAQIEEATAVLAEAKRRLYVILAAEASGDADADDPDAE